MKKHLLQSPEWEKYEKIEGKQTFQIDGEGFAAMAVLSHTPLGKYLFCPYGPTVQGDGPEACRKNFGLALEALKKLAEEQEAFFVRLEPTFSLSEIELGRTFGLKKSHDIDPAHTWVIDLTRTEEEILSEMPKESRRRWRNCGKKGITVRTTKNPEEIDILVNMLSKVSNRNHFIPQEKEHLYNQMQADFATLYVVELEGKPIASALIYDYDGVRYYAHVAAVDEYRKLFAGTILLIQMVVDAKRAGMKVFDFWGITTSTNKKHPWYGFTQFKKSFGGEQVDYAGTWDLPVRKLRYQLYRVVRRINRFKRKIQHRRQAD